jgi:hypothetical protein
MKMIDKIKEYIGEGKLLNTEPELEAFRIKFLEPRFKRVFAEFKKCPKRAKERFGQVTC